MFPKIEHINDVLPHIEGKKEFGVNKREWGTSIDYHYVATDTFHNEYALECRGIKFGHDGKIIARPLHKFHNIGEKEHTQEHALPWHNSHMILEKLDGSMVHPAIVDGQMLWMTRAGVSDVAKEAAKRVTPAIKTFSSHFIEYGLTPIFEWISPLNRIVVPYSEDKLVLIAMREMHSGIYRNYEEMRACISIFGNGSVPLVQAWSEDITDVAAFMAHTRGLQDQEGYVVRWRNGDMVKMKADAYVLMHKTKDALTWEKDVLALCLENRVDDVLPLLSEEDASALRAYNSALQTQIYGLAMGVAARVDAAKEALSDDRKRFALEIAPTFPKSLRPVAFYVWSGENADTAIRSMLKRHTSTRGDVDEVRGILGPVRWDRKVILDVA